MSSGMAMGSPLRGGPGTAVHIAPHQAGHSVKGTVDVSSAGAGARLAVVVLLGRHTLGATTQTVKPGLARFTVKLNRAGVAALVRAHRLKVTVRVGLTPATGKAVSIERTVVLSR